MRFALINQTSVPMAFWNRSEMVDSCVSLLADLRFSSSSGLLNNEAFNGGATDPRLEALPFAFVAGFVMAFEGGLVEGTLTLCLVAAEIVAILQVYPITSSGLKVTGSTRHTMLVLL